MFGRYGMRRNTGKRWRSRRGINYGVNSFECNGGLGFGIGYRCREEFNRDLLKDSAISTTQKELLEEQKLVLERRLERINSYLESYKGE